MTPSTSPDRSVPPTLATLARQLYQERRLRDASLPALNLLFGEPSWEMLLALFVAEDESRDLSVTDVVNVTGSDRADANTARRYLKALAQGGLVSHRHDPQRGDTVELTPRGREMMAAYLTRLLQLRW